MDVLLAILIFGALIMGFYLLLTYKSKSEKEYEEKVKKSLDEEYIIDPETGAKLTLEQAESGHWISHDNEFRKVSESELNLLPTDDEKQIEIALNYLRENKSYKKTQLTEEQLERFENSKLLNRYDNWSYSNPFEFKNGIVLLPAPEIYGNVYYEADYSESQLMFWIAIKNINGHYLLREKSSSEKILDFIRNDDDLKVKNYECFTFKKSHDIILIMNILKSFENEKKLEIEINNTDLFIKTTKLINLDDVLRIEKIINTILY